MWQPVAFPAIALLPNPLGVSDSPHDVSHREGVIHQVGPNGLGRVQVVNHLSLQVSLRNSVQQGLFCRLATLLPRERAEAGSSVRSVLRGDTKVSVPAVLVLGRGTFACWSHN